ncbi:sensor histidine kinase [Polaribacter sp. HaHaR_3_91]|uniref:sensor histidine kinase n=1 Tax=Polaribacter sp. HaHaR_3_91 TaxID=2745561 RepID=UPI001C4FABFC|nr:sensor histidine kinase [Polaribacter sp. HaHaR_3_91]QXP64710.1 sensor histidine kinase [Polaribacter sp. HaHaR_3_91]
MKTLSPLLKKNNTIIIVHCLIWIFFLVITAIQSYARLSTIPNEFYILNFTFIAVFYLNYLVLIPKFLLNKKIILYLLISLGIIFSITFIIKFCLKFSLRPPFPEGQFNPKFRGPRESNFNLRPPILLLIFFALSTCVKLVAEWYKSEKERTIAASQKVNSELSFLKAQLNPHFLFNTLNSIYSLANKKSDDTTVAIVTLSELMRYMIYEANENYICLEKEIEYIKNYISLQLLRLKDSSGVKINVHGNLNYRIEPLLLISFIENAFKYGTDYKGKTDITIKISTNDDQLHLNVYNLSSLQNALNKDSGIGLENIQNRLNLLYPNAHTLEITNTKKSFEVNLKINLKK